MTAIQRLRAALASQISRNVDPHSELVLIGPLVDGHPMALEVKPERESWQDDAEDEDVEYLSLFDMLAVLDELRELEQRKPIDRDAEPVEVDPGKRYMQILTEWLDNRTKLAYYKAQEMEQRKILFAGAFPNPKEGTQRFKLADGRTIVGQYKIGRKIDEAALPITLQHMRELGIANTDVLVTYKPSLAKREWNTLGEDAKLTFSAAVIATPGSPSLEIELPKAPK